MFQNQNELLLAKYDCTCKEFTSTFSGTPCTYMLNWRKKTRRLVLKKKRFLWSTPEWKGQKKKKEEKKLPNNFKQNSHSVNKCFSYHLIRLRGCQSITGKTVNHILCPTQIYYHNNSNRQIQLFCQTATIYTTTKCKFKKNNSLIDMIPNTKTVLVYAAKFAKEANSVRCL